MLIARKTTAVRHQPRITVHCDDYCALVQGYDGYHKELIDNVGDLNEEGE